MIFKNGKEAKRILIFELNWLGDILFSFPLIKAIKERQPDSYITCAVVKRYSALFAGNPWADEIVHLSDERGARGLLERMKFFFYVLKGGFRACVFLKPSTGKTLLAFLAGVTRRVGYKGKKDLFLTDKVVLPSGVRHKVDQLLELGRPLGIRNFDNRYDYHVPHADVAVMEKTVLDRSGSRGFKRLVALNPGGNWGPKRWPEERFVELGNMLAARYPDVGIVVTGAQKDKRAADSIVSAIGPERGFSMAGDTDLRSLAALFRMCSLVVSADSGPMHLASAVGVPVAGIFGPTSSGLTGPRGRGRIVIVQGDAQGCAVPCYEKDCGKGYGCMNGVSAERVFKKLVTILG